MGGNSVSDMWVSPEEAWEKYCPTQSLACESPQTSLALDLGEDPGIWATVWNPGKVHSGNMRLLCVVEGAGLEVGEWL